MAILPDEIIENILLRLPVKSLLRFRCVCKAWRALISDSEFAEMHYQQPQTQARSRVLISCPGRVIRSMDPDASGNDNSGVVNIDYPLEPSNLVFQILDSCDGLLCVIDSFHNPALWNPSTRQFNPLPKPTFLENSDILYGFTYDYSSDDYKIVRVVSTSRDVIKTEIDVFDLKTNEWRRVEETHYSRPAWDVGTFLNGAFYWLAWRLSEGHEGFSRVVVSFDLKEERFKEVELPSDVGIINLRVFGGYLSAMYHDLYGELTKMWVMEEKAGKDSWANVATLPFRSENDSDGPLLCWFANFLKNGGEFLLVINKWKLILYDFKTKTHKDIMFSGDLGLSIPVLYTETLVSPYCINETNEDV